MDVPRNPENMNYMLPGAAPATAPPDRMPDNMVAPGNSAYSSNTGVMETQPPVARQQQQQQQQQQHQPMPSTSGHIPNTYQPNTMDDSRNIPLAPMNTADNSASSGMYTGQVPSSAQTTSATSAHGQTTDTTKAGTGAGTHGFSHVSSAQEKSTPPPAVDDAEDTTPLTFYQNDQKFGNTMEALKVQREEGKYCDTTIIAGPQQFKAHACVLAGNSNYFDMLLKATDEHGTGSKEFNIVFPTHNHRIAKLLLDYMYTGYLGVNMTIVGHMIVTSRQLGMNDVIQCCSMHLINKLSVSSWAQIYDIAKKYELPELRRDIHKYLAKNFSSICKTRGFLKIEYEDLKAILNECEAIKGVDYTQYQYCALLSWVASRCSARVDYYAPLCGLIKVDRLDTSFVSAALNSEQIYNTGLVDHFCSIEILERLAQKESLKKKARKSSNPTRLPSSAQGSGEGGSFNEEEEDDDYDSDLDMSCDDVTMSDYANGADSVYDAGSYERLMAARDADDPDRYKGTPKKRKRQDIIKVASLPGEVTTPKRSSSTSPGKRKSSGGKETFIPCEWPGCTSVYSSRRKTDLQDHMNAHNGLRPHECAICGKTFSARKHRQRHEKIHLEVPPLACNIEECAFRTHRGDKLKDHMLKIHGYIP